MNAHAIAACLAILFPVATAADPLPALAQAKQAHWRAVGIVNAEGLDGIASCTGTLIAPDLVLTAAHCAWGDAPRYFVVDGVKAGTAYRTAGIEIHPDYTRAADIWARYAVDLALLRLERPVPDVTPIDILPEPVAAPDSGIFALLGYHRMRPAVLNGRFDCAAMPGAAALHMVLDCAVIAGNSGGPVLARGAKGWHVVGVAVAALGQRPDNQALIAVLGDWARAAR